MWIAIVWAEAFSGQAVRREHFNAVMMSAFRAGGNLR